MRIHRPITPALAPNQRRAICSGDSFAFGSGVSDDETLCAYLEGEIPHLETVNMAQRGYGIDQAYLWYRRDAARWPHQLHLFMFIWADFERMAVTSFTGYPKPIMELHDGALVTKNVPGPPWSGSTRGYEIAGILSGRASSSSCNAASTRAIPPSSLASTPRCGMSPKACSRDLARLNADRHSALVLVYLPTLADYTPGAYDTRRARLTAFSKRTGIPFVDLTSDLRTVSRDSVDWLFITANQLPVQGSAGHYTARGNAWAAAQLAKHLRTVPAAASALPQSTAPTTAPVARRSAAKGAVLSVLVVTFATLLSVLVLEGGASWLLALLDYRDARAATLRPSVQRDTLLAWSGKAAYANPNAFGRGVALTLDSSGARMSAGDSGLANRPSFVCSGDSYTFGLGVGDAQPWCAVLQHLLMMRGVNIAQPDFGIDQSYRRIAATVSARRSNGCISLRSPRPRSSMPAAPHFKDGTSRISHSKTAR